jgi:hypothetical protein
MGNQHLIELFSLRFGIPVVCLRDHQNKAEVLSTNDVAEWVRKFCGWTRSNYDGPESKLWDPPSGISEAIFLWQHTTTAYTLLEPLSGQQNITPESLVITDVYVIPVSKHNKYDREKELFAVNNKTDDEEDLWDRELFNDVAEETKAAEAKAIQEKKDAEWEAEAKAAAEEKKLAERKALQEKQADEAKEAEAKAAAEEKKAAERKALQEKQADEAKEAEAKAAAEEKKAAERKALQEKQAELAKEAEAKAAAEEKKAAEGKDLIAAAAAEKLQSKKKAHQKKKETEEKPVVEERRDKLPEFVCLPTCILSNIFPECSFSASKQNIVFKTHGVLGDGNCLYRCLSESPIFIQENKGWDGKYRELRSFISLHAETPALKALAFRVWKIWKRQGESDTETDTAHFKQWLEEIRTPTLWGGSTELILFAATFGIHVISVEQVEDIINLSTTTDAFAKLKIRPSIPTKPGFGTKPPSDIKEVIFLWNHDYGNPTKRRKSTDRAGNHYTLLELSERKHKDLPKSTYYFRHDITSSSTPIKKPTLVSSPIVLSSTSKGERKKNVENATLEKMKDRAKRTREDILKNKEESDSDVAIRPKRKKTRRPVIEDTDDSDTSDQPLSSLIKKKSGQHEKSSSNDDFIIPKKPNKKRENPITSPNPRINSPPDKKKAKLQPSHPRMHPYCCAKILL